MSASHFILTRCLRCGEKYELEIGLNLADFCGTCRGKVGRRMVDQRQLRMNSNYDFQKAALNEHPRTLVFHGRHFVARKLT